MSEVLRAVERVIEVSREDVGGKTPVDEPIRMMDNPLDGFRNGALLDLRVRFAMDMLMHSPMFSTTITAQDAAVHALSTAIALMDLAQKRGLVEPFPEGLDEHLVSHVRRQVAYQVEQQAEGRRAQEQGDRIARSVAQAFRKPS